jgi:hypothetical protein
MPIAKSVQDVILGEAAYTGVKDITYADMMGIASVIKNRALALGVDYDDVISVNSEFDAYGKQLPPGVGAYRSLAEDAWADVLTNGSITDATFYATPAAVDNLPSGLEQQAAVPGGHVYFSDPLERSIKTKLGYKQPANLATVRAAVEQRQIADFEEGIPTPEARPDVAQAQVSANAAAPSLEGSDVVAAGARMGEPTVDIDPGRTGQNCSGSKRSTFIPCHGECSFSVQDLSVFYVRNRSGAHGYRAQHGGSEYPGRARPRIQRTPHVCGSCRCPDCS